MEVTARHDVAIIVCSRGRQTHLARLLHDIEQAFAPALQAAGLSVCTFVYAQAYAADFLDGIAKTFAAAIADGRLVVVAAERPHTRIGDVVATAIEAVHERATYRLAMLMDDDSLYRADREIDENLRRAALRFIARGDRAYSIKLGPNRALEFWPFIDPGGPIMPFKEKMLWASRAVLDEVLAVPRFRDLAIGEDTVIAAVAWRGDARRCCGVFGLASFVHLSFEPDPEQASGPIAGGYADLVGAVPKGAEHGKYDAALRSGATHFHVMPEIFVGEDHPHFIYAGIRPEAVTRHAPDAGPFRRLSPIAETIVSCADR